METKKGFLELLFLTDEQEYTIDRYWERGGIFVLLPLIPQHFSLTLFIIS